MAWSKRSKNWNEDRATSEGAEWIHTTSIDQALNDVRKVWKEHGINTEKSDWEIIKLSHIAVMRGLTRRVTPWIVRLLERREADGKLTWHLEERVIGTIGISMVRLFAAHIEDPSVPIKKAREDVTLFLRSIEAFNDLKSVRDLMPLIEATRLDVPGETKRVSKRHSNLPLRTDMEASGMCAAAHRQWRVEYLLAMGAEEEAIELAHKGRSEQPCGNTCAFAPHSMYAWLLEPLHRLGRKDEARVLHDRLETLMVPRTLYLNAMGHRAHYLALEGRFADAIHLMRSMLPMAQQSDASPWQVRKFHEGCERALSLICASDHASSLDVADLVEVTHVSLQGLRAQFARRNSE